MNQLQETLSQAETLGRDCHVVAPLGTNATIDAGWTTLHEHFHQQTGRLASLPVDSSSFPEEVRVAVVDSTPHGYDGGEAGQDRLGHGHAIGRIIRELGCPEGSPACVAQVANHLALPLVTPTVWDTENGGYFGLQTHLARAIHSSVSEWRSYNENLETGASPQPRLVVNLSLAWDGRYGGAYNVLGDLPAPVRAVHAAITHAVCRGALVVAAAGNDPGGPDPVIGPMFPAGWETKAAPTPSDCEDLEGKGYRDEELYPSFPPPGWSGYRPLVYAVGGVRGDDRPLASTRPGGRPRTAAPGAHAVAEDANGNAVPTDVLTGTSASTAVVSGIAATVWGYRPELSGPEVMGLIRRASVDLGQ
ncbi:MAG TPA: S8/S53 family peptidase, partial [Myxococcaceae bacterium]|nr:S8/S53 family peptidase [Myxococcaceae bacterium]